LVPIFEYMVAWVEIKSNKYLSDIPIWLQKQIINFLSNYFGHGI
jgi:hypothetical protein